MLIEADVRPRTNAEQRQAKAMAIRRRIIDAARELFVRRGYTATAMDVLAQHAGVGSHVIGFTFGTKRDLLMAVLDAATAGTAIPETDAPCDAAQRIHWHVRTVAAAYRRAADVLGVVCAAAATDPEIAKRWQANVAERLAAHRLLAQALAADLRPEITVAEAADFSHALLSPEVYVTLTGERGWPDERWRTWVADVLTRQLLKPTGM